MLTDLLRIALTVTLAGAFGLQTARADIYTWVDASGSINVSNLAPPDGVHVTKVLRASATGDQPARDATRQAETQALAERVRQLEDEVELARRQAPPPVDYRPVPLPPVVPPVVQYIINPEPALTQYAAIGPPPANPWCDPTWPSCGLAWGQAFYPASVFVLRAPNFRHFQPAPGGHHVAVHPPMRPPNGFRRG